jgi:hypothetical protein
VGYRQGILELKDAIAGLEKLPKSKQFVTSQFFGCAYVGGEGSSKTASLCCSAICNAWIDPGGKSLIGRLNMPALESTTMNDFLCMVPENAGEWEDTKKTFTFGNGHKTLFRHLDIADPKIFGHIKSENLSAAFIDEASEIDEKVFLLFVGRLRRAGAQRRILRLSSNPAGHDYMWRHFFDPDRKKEWKDLFLGISSSSDDNVFLPPEYTKIRRAVYPSDWADRFINGSFTDFTDLVYKEFTEPSHIYDDSRHWEAFRGENSPPKDWPVIVGMDIGSGAEGDPWALPIIAVSPDGRLYQFAEIYGVDLRIAPIAEQLHMHLQGRTLEGLAYDYAQRAAAQELEEYGLGGVPALKERRPGLFKTEQYMHIDARLEHPFNPEIKGSPRYFVAKSCTNTINDVTGYKWPKDRSGAAKNDFSTNHEHSHAPDGIRYAIHTFRPLPTEMQAPKKWENQALDVASRLYWQRAEEHKEKEPLRRHGFSTLRLNQERVKARREIVPQ